MRFGGDISVELLYLRQRQLNAQPEDDEAKAPIGHGVRMDIYQSNSTRLFLEYTDLPKAYGRNRSLSGDEEDKTPFDAKIGVLKNFNWYEKSYGNNYDKSFLAAELNRTKTWHMALNSKILGGNIKFGENEITRTKQNVAFQLLFEKDIKVVEEIFITAGAGTSFLRGFTGKNYNRTYSGDYALSNINSLMYSNITFDIPVGIRYYPTVVEEDGLPFWVSAKGEIVINAINTLAPSSASGEKKSEFGDANMESFNAVVKPTYTKLLIGAGFDYFYNLDKRFRWGVSYEFTPGSIFSDGIDYNPNGIVLSLATSL